MGARKLKPTFVLLFTAILFLHRLSCPLLEPEEARYAEIPRQMLAAGRWLVPVYFGETYSHKPPLLYWLVMLSYKAFGAHDWAARLIPAAAGVLTVAVVYFWGRQSFGVAVGTTGALVLALSVQFVYRAGMLSMDGLLCLGLVCSWAAGLCALQLPRLRWPTWLLSALFCGLGVLTKGPVALILGPAPLLLLPLIHRRCNRPAFLAWLAYLGVAVAVAGPWYAAVAIGDPHFLQDFVWTHNLRRYLAPLDHEEPWWFFLPGLLLGMMPWTLLVPGLARTLWRRRRARAKSPIVLLVPFVVCLVFFSLSGCKRAGYLLPALPPFALLLAWFWVLEKKRRGWSHRPLEAYLAGAMAVGFVLFSPWYHERFSLRGQALAVRDLAQEKSVPVCCYPRRWDSVPFYLGRDDVHWFPAERRGELMADLRSQQETVIFVKSDRHLRDFIRDLPEWLEFVPQGEGSNVTAGLVRRREFSPVLRAGERDACLSP